VVIARIIGWFAADSRQSPAEKKRFLIARRDLSHAPGSKRIMATNSRDSLQKVEVRGKGLGGFSEADLERRAKELALIDNRTNVTDEDRAAALA
jgi:hypothetical protein